MVIERNDTMAKVVDGRLYLPLEEGQTSNQRKVLHPETNAANVLVGDGSKNLEEVLGQQIVISEEKPANAGLWFNITKRS